ncbi:1-deoxy-D-xylulose-5-phosphate reductoisomerase [Stappia sp. GBMRC 2046]|uniref:1-deoxy-D-xylulose 5-phosphate reductoisomerase n=1 Tax=Stappia sediminis TaxID=2692190 RepID=A0A7X3LXP2_9HYPH|nr:1-deoxy-D-xylulose-5-phosphate reductoisomerase [Stappia sediminis]MXN67017.1 1-deoxy-D-xylulose-5-phosphate reductoisomerase [Stappia sediminis]
MAHEHGNSLKLAVPRKVGAQAAPKQKHGQLRLSILGATGSIGQSTLDIITHNPERFAVAAVTANRNAHGLADAAIRVGAERAVLADAEGYGLLKDLLAGTGIGVAAGPEAVEEAATCDAGMVVAAIVGAAGLAPTLAAVKKGRAIALANKECLVCAGSLFMEMADRHGATILPVDSEHNAIFQVLEARNAEQVEKVILTASGGPFRDKTLEEMRSVSPEEALKHPNWDMGQRISIDSATMMNKGFEVIEAHHLYGLPAERLEVLVHPQSAVHGLVQYRDGSLLAQMGTPDMRTPIAHCLAWPERIPVATQRLDLAALGSLTFEKPDGLRFPALPLAYRALETGMAATAALNAADEVAVDAFLRRRIGFLDITAIVERTIETLERAGDLSGCGSIFDVMNVDGAARRLAEGFSRS